MKVKIKELEEFIEEKMNDYFDKYEVPIFGFNGTSKQMARKLKRKGFYLINGTLYGSDNLPCAFNSDYVASFFKET